MNTNATISTVAGSWVTCHVSQIAGFENMNELVVNNILSGIAAVAGPAAEKNLADNGLEYLHRVITPIQVTALRDNVLDKLRWRLFEFAVAVGEQVLGLKHEFYVDDYQILRVNIPYELARNADPRAENPGVGRLSPAVRDLARSRRVIDPVYDPKSYHRGHPAAAWAHGPHLDSWAGHSKSGKNIWWAVSDVPAEAGMVLYPDLRPESLEPDARSLYLKAGSALPPPTRLPLTAGEMLVFDPEVLHGTHLNITSTTRLAVSLRLNESKPTFSRSCFYAREFWRKSSDIKNGKDEVLFLQREDNFGPDDPIPAKGASAPKVATAEGKVTDDGNSIRVQRELGTAGTFPLSVNIPDGKYLIFRAKSGLRAIRASCPHYGLDLADGGFDGHTLYCPGCAVGFDIETGLSASPSLKLDILPVHEINGALHIVLQRIA